MNDCYLAALRILKYRFNSTAELRRKLRAKKFDRQTIESTLERLRTEKWLDDERFAAAYARTRALKSKGGLRIRHELMRAGVDDATISRAVSASVSADDERERATALAQKRLPNLVKRYGADAARNKLTAYLLKQGYDAALVREIVKGMHDLSSRA